MAHSPAKDIAPSSADQNQPTMVWGKKDPFFVHGRRLGRFVGFVGRIFDSFWLSYDART